LSADGSIIYHRTPKRRPVYRVAATALFMIGALLVLVCISLIPMLLTQILGVAAFAGFGYCAWMVGRRTNRRNRVYAIDHDGFALFGPDGERSLSVDWKAVQGIGVSDFGYGKVLTFAFRDPEEVKSQMTPEQRARAEANEAAGIPTLTIQQGALDTDVDEIRTISSRFFFAVG